jgi:hypothetical protein
VASCGVARYSPPRNLDNACSILAQRPAFDRAFQAVKRKWGVPVHVQMAIIHQESSFKADARTPMKYFLGIIPTGRQSSAFGYSQALDGTWKEYRQSTGRLGARRDDIYDAADFIGWYLAASNRELGISLSDTRNQYLAYHEGRTGYKRRSYNSKRWLLDVSAKVRARSNTYERQLRICGRS